MKKTHLFSENHHYRKVIENLEQDIELKKGLFRLWSETNPLGYHRETAELLEKSIPVYIDEVIPHDATCEDITVQLNEFKDHINSTQHLIQNTLENQCSTFITVQKHVKDAFALSKEHAHALRNIETHRYESHCNLESVWSDISRLEKARENLRDTILLLKYTACFVSGIQYLESLCSEKRYHEAIPLIKIVKHIAESLEQYKHCSTVQDLLRQYDLFQNTLQLQFVAAFESLLDSDNVDPSSFPEMCDFVDNLPSETLRQNILEHFIESYLEGYYKMFPLQTSLAHPQIAFQSVERRFSYFKKLLRDFNSTLEKHFPTHWNVSFYLCRRYCRILLYQFTEILKTSQIETETLVQALIKSWDFENFLISKLDEDNMNTLQETQAEQFKKTAPPMENNDLASVIPYLDLLSKNFAQDVNQISDSEQLLTHKKQGSFLWGDIVLFLSVHGTLDQGPGNKLIGEAINHDKILYDQASNKEGSVLGINQPRTLYVSCIDVLAAMKEVFQKCPCVTTETIFNEMVQMLRNSFTLYLEQIKTRESQEIKNRKKDAAVALLGTVEFIELALPHLCLALCKEPENQNPLALFPDQVTILSELKTNTLSQLCGLIDPTLNPYLEDLSRIDWVALCTVINESFWVNRLIESMEKYIAWLKRNLSVILLRQFFDHFLEHFLMKYRDALYVCQGISESGAQQLLVDTESLKTFFYNLPSRFLEQESALYIKAVVREFGDLEMLLKILALSSSLPHETVLELLKQNANITSSDDLERILKLRVV